MSEDQYQTKRQEILSNFNPEFIEKVYHTDPTFYAIYNMLMRNADPYQIIEQLITDRISLSESFYKLMMTHHNPKAALAETP